MAGPDRAARIAETARALSLAAVQADPKSPTSRPSALTPSTSTPHSLHIDLDCIDAMSEGLLSSSSSDPYPEEYVQAMLDNYVRSDRAKFCTPRHPESGRLASEQPAALGGHEAAHVRKQLDESIPAACLQ